MLISPNLFKRYIHRVIFRLVSTFDRRIRYFFVRYRASVFAEGLKTYFAVLGQSRAGDSISSTPKTTFWVDCIQ